MSWFAFANAAAARTGRDTNRVVPASGTDTWGPAPRPRFSALTSRRGRLLRPLSDALDAYVHENETIDHLNGIVRCAS